MKKSDFNRAIYEFLHKEQISLETDLVNEFTYQMAGVELKPNPDRYNAFPGFSLRSYSYDKSEAIQFELPNLSMRDIQTMLTFFNIPEDQYSHRDPLKINEQSAKDFLEKFKAYFEFMKENNPQEITKYRIKSKPILEASAIATIKEYTKETLKLVLENAEPNQVANNSLVKYLLRLKSAMSDVSEQPILFMAVIAMKERLNSFMRESAIKSNPKLRSQLQLIGEGIDLYTQYNRAESALANKAFTKEIENFLVANHQISSTQCSIVEDVLLQLAAAKLGPKGAAKLQIGSDPSRLVFTFEDIDEANTAKILDFLQKLGDATAIEGYGNRKYATSIPKAMMLMDIGELESVSIPTDYKEQHSIETDGKFFYEKVLPYITTAVDRLKLMDPMRFENYQLASKAYFDKKLADKFNKSPGTPKPICPFFSAEQKDAEINSNNNATPQKIARIS